MAKVDDDKMKDAVDTAADGARDAVDTAQQKVSTGLDQASELVSNMTGKATGAIKKYPVRTVLLVTLGAAVVGFIVGIISSDRD